jgi:hypothetical protein
MTVTASVNNGFSGMIVMGVTTSYSWVRNVESDGTNPGWEGRHIEMNGFRNTVRDSYIHHAKDIMYGGIAYGICIRGSRGLIENNICYMLNKPLVAMTSGGGNVIGYNYVTNASVRLEWQETAIDASHAGFCHSDLYEGNYTTNIATDAQYGSNGQIVFFRNYASGRNQNMQDTSSLRAMCIAGWQQRHASIGNVLLHPNFVSGATVFSVPQSLVAPLNNELNVRLGTTGVTYVNNQTSTPITVYRLGAHAWNLPAGSNAGLNWDTGRTFENFYRHLDFNPIEGLYIDLNNPVQTLPYSLYLDGQPAWWSGHPWPPVNPLGATHAERVTGLPAKTRAGAPFADSP